MSTRRSLQYQRQAAQLIPGMSQLLSKRPDMFSLGVWPAYYKKAEGVHVWDLDGNKYIDMSIAGIGANVLGYADPDVNRAVIAAVNNGSSSSLNCAEEVDLAQMLCDIHPWAKKVRFTRCGGEAMAVAVRIARAYTKKDKVAICGYHGWHDWYLAANLGTANALGEHLLPGLSPVGVPKGLQGTALPFGYNKIDELKQILIKNRGQVAAVVMEPIRNIAPLPGFLAAVKKLAAAHGAVFIFDEVSSGFRCYTSGMHMHYKVTPDMAVFSKAMGNGFPIAAIIGKGNVMEAAEESFISSTMWTERVGFVAALATIKKHRQKNVGAHLVRMGRMVQDGWQQAAKKAGLSIHVGGIEPLSHFTFDGSMHLTMKAYYVQEMLKAGFLASNIFYPMYAHTPQHVKAYLKATEIIFTRMALLAKKGQLSRALKGKPSAAGFKRVT